MRILYKHQIMKAFGVFIKLISIRYKSMTMPWRQATAVKPKLKENARKIEKTVSWPSLVSFPQRLVAPV